MSNEYWTFSDPLGLGLARNDRLNAFFEGIELAFEKLPPAGNIALGLINYGEATGAGGNYLVSLTPPVTELVEGMKVQFKANHANSGAATLSVDGLEAKQIRDYAGESLSAGMIPADGVVELRYAGGVFRLNTIVTENIPPDASITAAKLAGDSGAITDILTKLGLFPKQSSVSDTTANRGLIQGAHGLGADVPTIASPQTTSLHTGFGRASAVAGADIWARIAATTAEMFDIIGVPSTEKLYFRSRTGSSWKERLEVAFLNTALARFTGDIQAEKATLAELFGGAATLSGSLIALHAALSGNLSALHGTFTGNLAISGTARVGGNDIYHEGNVRGSVSQSGGVPTGALIEDGTNSNGYYVRFANGLQVCLHNAIELAFVASDNCGAQWTFPASFVTAKELVVLPILQGGSSIGTNSTGLGATTTAVGRSDFSAIAVGPRSSSSAVVRAFRGTGNNNFQSGDVVYSAVLAIGFWHAS